MSIQLINEKISYIVNRLPLQNLKEVAEIRGKAMQIAKDYLSQLSDSEERFPIDVALSAIYISCKENKTRMSQADISHISGYSLNGWPTLVKDMEKQRSKT